MYSVYQNCSEVEIKGKLAKTDAVYAGLRKTFRPLRLGGRLGHSRSTINHPFYKYIKKRLFIFQIKVIKIRIKIYKLYNGIKIKKRDWWVIRRWKWSHGRGFDYFWTSWVSW